MADDKYAFADFGIKFDVETSPGEPEAPAAEHPQRDSYAFADFGITFDQPEVAPTPVAIEPDKTIVQSPYAFGDFGIDVEPAPAEPRFEPSPYAFGDFGIDEGPDVTRESDDIFSLQTIGAAARGIASGIIDVAIQTPSTMIEAVGAELRDRNLPEIAGDWAKFSLFWNPIVAQIVGKGAEELTSWITNVEPGEDPNEIQSALGSMLNEWGNTSRKYWEGVTEKHIKPDAWWENKKVFDNPEVLMSPTWWAYNLGNLGTNLAATILPARGAANAVKLSKWAGKLNPKTMAKIAKLGDAALKQAQTAKAMRQARAAGMVAGGITGGMLEGSGTYRSVIEAGGSPEEALRAAQLQFLYTSGLNAISLGKWLEEPAQKLTARLAQKLGRGVFEAITEGLEEPAEAIAMIQAKMENGEIPEDRVGLILDGMKESLDVAAPSLVLGFFAPLGGKDQSAASLTRARRIFGDKERMETTAGKAIAEQDLDLDQLQETRDRMQQATPESEILGDLDKLIDTKVKRIEIGEALRGVARAREAEPTAVEEVAAVLEPGEVERAIEEGKYIDRDSGKIFEVPENQGGDIETAKEVMIEEYGAFADDIEESHFLNEEQRRVLDVADAIGAKVTFYRPRAGSTPDLVNGFHLNANRRIYLNTNNQDPQVQILGHESFHKLRLDDRKAFDSLMEVVKESATNFEEYKTKINSARTQAGMLQLDDKAILEEFAADLVGDSFTKTSFWKAVNKHDPGMGRKLADIVVGLINSIRNRFTKDSPEVAQADRIEEAIAKVYADVIKEARAKRKKVAKIPTRQAELPLAAKIKEAEKVITEKKPTEEEIVTRSLEFFWDMYDAGEITAERLLEVLEKAPAVQASVKVAAPTVFFKETKQSETLDIEDVAITETVKADKVTRAKINILQAAQGRIPKRDPLTVYKRETDGKLVVIDGNSTVVAMRDLGIGQIMARVFEHAPQAKVKTLNDSYEQAAEVRDELVAITNRFAKQFGAKAIHRLGLKDKKRAAEKAKNYGHPRFVKDIIGSTLTFKDAAAVKKAAAEIAKVVDVVEIEDRMAESMDGYNDMVVLVRLSNGYLGEMLLLEESVQAVKGIDATAPGHRIFEALRVLREHDQKETDSIAARYADRIADLSKQTYDHFRSADIDFAKPLALPSDISLDLITILEDPGFFEMSTSLSPSSRKIFRELVSYLKGIPSDIRKRFAITVSPPFKINLLKDPIDVKRKIDLSIKKSRLDVKAWQRKLDLLGPDAYTIHEAGDAEIVMSIKKRKWTVDFDDTQFGSVNNRLSRELDVFEQVFGPSPLAQQFPGKFVKGKRPPTRTIRPYDLLTEMYRVIESGEAAEVMDRTIPIKDLVKKRGLKGQAAKNFTDKVDMLRKGTLFLELDEKGAPILSNNGKAGMSTDLMLATCHPTTPCRECYAAGLTRQAIINKSVRNTLHILMDPKGWARRVAAEAAQVPRAELPFIRLQGSGDLITGEQVTAYNELAKHADRPIQIFSRHHDMLRRLKGTANAPFLKVGSIDSDLFKHYGMKFLKENMTKHGIMNGFLYLDQGEIPMIQELYDNDALGLVLAADSKLHEDLPVNVQRTSCPCDADERSYHSSCRQCALSYQGCFLSMQDWAIDAKGKLWKLSDPKLPKKAYPILQFMKGVTAPTGWTAEAFGYSLVAQKVIQANIDLVKKIYLPQLRNPKHKRTEVPLKDVRWPKDVQYVSDEGRIQAWIENMMLIKELAAQGTFYLPGGLIQPPLAFKNGVKLADATVISDEDAKNISFSVKRSNRYPVGKYIGGAVYVHRSAENVLPNVEKAKQSLPEGWNYAVVKYNEKTGGYTFIKSDDFNSADEPTVGDGILVKKDGSTKEIKQAKDPWIYHHKWMFVDDNYTGFDINASKRRSEHWTGLPDIDKSRIGKRSYWEKNVTVHIPDDVVGESTKRAHKNEEVAVANATARAAGAVGARAKVPRAVKAIAKKTASILDFGAGPKAMHTQSLIKDGFKKTTAYEFGDNANPAVHDLKALQKKHDVVFGSNVMNVQSSREMFAQTMGEIAGATKASGTVVLNMPSEPRKGFLGKMTYAEARNFLETALNDRFVEVERAKIDGKTQNDVFVAHKKRKVSLKIKSAAQFQHNMPTFKRWFGKSVVKDPDGQPAIMFHGTDSSFAEFLIRPWSRPPASLIKRQRRLYKKRNVLADAGKIGTPEWNSHLNKMNEVDQAIDHILSRQTPRGQAAFFTEDPQYASIYAKAEELTSWITNNVRVRRTGQLAPQMYPVFLKIEKPLDMGNVDKPITLKEFEKRIGIKFDGLKEYRNQAKAPYQWYTNYPQIFQAIKKAGYDGITGIEAGHKMYAVFSPTQIKSIFNRGTYDVQAKDISMSIKKQRWYSQMEQVLEKKLPGKGTGASYLQTIDAWAKKGMFKAEEWEWSGLRDVLEQTPKTKYGKAEVMEILAENNIRVEEIVLKDIENAREFRRAVAEDVERRVVEVGLEFTSWQEDALADAKNDYIHDNDADGLKDILDDLELESFYTVKEEIRSEFEGAGRAPRHEEYTLDGADNYRELLITLPTIWDDRFLNFRNKMKDKYGKEWETEMGAEELSLAIHLETMKKLENQYYGPEIHYGDTPNILAFIRFNERQDSEGRKILFIEELQSDWHQEGFKKGYQDPKVRSDAHRRVDDMIERHREAWMKQAMSADPRMTRRHAETLVRKFDSYNIAVYLGKDKEYSEAVQTTRTDEGLPNAPYKKTWPILAIKRMVRWAAENNFDGVAWAPGEVHQERYDMRRHLSEIRYREQDGKYRLTFLNLDGDIVELQNELGRKEWLTPDELDRLAGKSIADRIIAGEGALSDGEMSLVGEDLTVGGESLSRFYDRQLVNEANRFFSKAAWGKPKVEVASIIISPLHKSMGYPINPETGKAETWYSPTEYNQNAVARAIPPEQYLAARKGFIESGGRVTPLDDALQAAWVLPVTNEMKQKALHEGMPKFSMKDVSTNKHSVLRTKQIESMATPEALEAMGLNERGIPFWSDFIARRSGAPVKEVRKEYEELYGKLRKMRIGETEVMIGGRDQVPRFMVKAWHGSPYAFDQFTTDKIGSGEGFQAFGWGLYFTDRKSIAEFYAKKLTRGAKREMFLGGREIAEYAEEHGGESDRYVDEVRKAVEKFFEATEDQLADPDDAYITVGVDLDIVSSMIRQLYVDAITVKERENLLAASDFVKDVRLQFSNGEVPRPGKIIKKDRRLYRVRLHDGKTPDQYVWLDWYQTVPVKDLRAIRKRMKVEGVKSDVIKQFDVVIDRADITGQRLYDWIADRDVYGNQRDASLFLLRAGIDGIRYPADSLRRGSKTRYNKKAPQNYVVFDEDAVSIEQQITFSAKKNQDQIAHDYIAMLEDSLPTPDVTGPAATVNPLILAPKEVRVGVERNKGIKKPPFMKRVHSMLLETKNAFLRHRPYLDPKSQGDILNVLRIHQEVPENARRRAMEVLDNILDGLDANQYSTFTLAIIMDDMMRDIESGLLKDDKGLPFGFKSTKEAKAFRDKVFNIVSKDKMIENALARRQAVNRKLKQILVKYGLLNEDVLDDDRYFHHQVMMYREANSLGEQFGLTTGTAQRRVQQRKQGWQKARTGSILDYNTDYAQSEFEVLAQAFTQLETMESLNRLKAMADKTEEVKAVAKERGLENWEDAIPPGFVQWSPAVGSAWYKANSITDRLLHQLISQEVALTDENKDDIIKSTWVRGRDPRWVITEGLAKTLNDFGKVGDDHAFSRGSRFLMSAWKKWILINPFRVLKYNLNNMSGDLDIALAYDPRIAAYGWKAAKDLLKDWRKKELPTELRKEIEQARRLGVIGSGWSVQEISDVAKELSFNNFQAMLDGKRPDLIEKMIQSPRVAWKGLKDFTAWRENWLRLGAFRFFKDEIAAGKKNLYGASNRAEIDMIKNDTERAAKLSRDLIGDYGNISHAGQWIRAHMIPFYAWLEVNAPRYVRLMRNLVHEKKSVKLLSASAARRAVFLAIKANLLMAFVQIINRAVFPDEEDELTEAQRRQQHIILGRRADGSVRTLRFQGALSDALNWFGLENPWHDAEMLLTGKVAAKEQMREMISAPFVKVIQGFRPDVKTFGEALVGYSLYPDPFSPRPIRDKVGHVARMFSMDKLYAVATGKPRRGETATKRLVHDITSLMVYGSDPGEGAYYQTKAWMYTFLDRIDVERPAARPTSRSNAMFYYKQALKFGDLPAAERYLEKYYKLGGTYKGLQQSIKRAHPLAGMKAVYRRQFLASLNERQKEVIDMATAWYYRTYVQGQRRVPMAAVSKRVREEQQKTLRNIRGQ